MTLEPAPRGRGVLLDTKETYTVFGSEPEVAMAITGDTSGKILDLPFRFIRIRQGRRPLD